MKHKGLNKFLDSWKVVLFSFLGAATFWLFTALNKEYSALVSYPIDIQFDSDSVVIIDPLPTQIKVDVTSGGWNLFRRTLWFSVTPVKIPLDNPTDIRFLTRSTLLPVVQDQLQELDVNFLLTDTLFINIEKKVYKEVAIKVDSVNISMANNYRMITPITIDPPTVTLSGPETIISSLQNEYYVMIRETRIDNDVAEEVSIPLPFENLMSTFPGSVIISFGVDRFDRERIKVPIEQLNFPEQDSVIVEDSMITVNYTIQRLLKEDFDADDFGITVDYNLLNEVDSTIQPIIIYYPENISEITTAPEQIKLRYEQ